MTSFDIAARTVMATPGSNVHDALDINDNGTFGWPDALAWLFFATVGLLGVSVLLGMVFAGMTATVHGLVRVGRITRGGAHRWLADRR
jgi:hypothetical protein